MAFSLYNVSLSRASGFQLDPLPLGSCLESPVSPVDKHQHHEQKSRLPCCRSQALQCHSGVRKSNRSQDYTMSKAFVSGIVAHIRIIHGVNAYSYSGPMQSLGIEPIEPNPFPACPSLPGIRQKASLECTSSQKQSPPERPCTCLSESQNTAGAESQGAPRWLNAIHKPAGNHWCQRRKRGPGRTWAAGGSKLHDSPHPFPP